jgi:signal transduction histidine kinase/DNA-binding response OmpR family regulator/ligand-binding sensor domain-containing protein
MARDDQGYIWIGTRRGLNRYNGSTYKIFYQDAETPLSSDYIQSLLPDSGNRLWVGTASGINLVQNSRVIRKAKDEFNNVVAIADLDPKRLIYLGNRGLTEYDKQSGTERRILPYDKILFSGTIYLTTHGYILVYGIGRAGEVFVLDRDYKQVGSLFPDGEKGVHSIVELSDGAIFFATPTGLKVYSKDLEPLEVPENLAALTQTHPVVFLKSAPGDSTAVIGLQDLGLFEFNRNASKIEQLWKNERLEDTEFAVCLVTDNNVWLSKDHDGIDYISKRQDKNLIPVPHYNARESLNFFYPLDDGNLLILTNFSLYYWNIESMSDRDITPPDLRGNESLRYSVFDRNSDLWINYGDHSLRKYHYSDGKLNLTQRWDNYEIDALWMDEKGEVLILSRNEIINPATSTHVQIVNKPRDSDFWFISTLKDGSPYFMDNDHLYLLVSGNELKALPVDIAFPSCMYKDKEGTYWIGTSSSGVYRYDPEDGSLDHIDYEDGLSDSSIRSIIGDEEGNIWVCCRNDVLRISGEDGHMTAFGNPDNMVFNYNVNSAGILKDGRVLFGSRNAIVGFSSRQFDGLPTIQFSLDEMRAGVRLIEDAQDKTVLSHKDNQITFHYSGMNFTPGSRLYYQYMLEGYDRNWIYAGTNQRVSYSGLGRGNYTFKVRAQLISGEWSDAGTLKTFRIKPSPWLSTPSLILYFLLAITLLFLSIRQIILLRLRGERLELAEQEKYLTEQLSKEKSDFFTNISHEFRTPLALIYGPVKDLSRNNTLDAHDRSLVDLVERNTRKMIKLTEQILNFNKAGDDMERLRIVRTNLGFMLRSLIGNFEYLLKEKNLSLSLEIPEIMDTWCDREKVEKVFFNLLSNAIKYTPEGGSVTIVATKSEEGEASIMVKDTGIGIDKDMMDKIFRRYERQNKLVGGKDPGGFGIGLHYAIYLANLHKGSLSVCPNKPVGSIFEFRFPARKESYSENEVWESDIEMDPAELMEPAAGTETKESTVMIVDDNSDIRLYLQSLLADQYNVVMAADGQEGWKSLKISIPDVIISDIMMPYMDGYALCRSIKESPEYCHIPVILLTAKQDHESMLSGLETGADAYISKPFDPLILKATVSNILKNRKRMQEMLVDRTSSTPESTPEEVKLNSHDRAFLDKLYQLLDEHLSEEEFNVTMLAREMCMSRTSLFSKTKALLGESPQAFLTNYRLNKAMELLKTHEMNISEISYRVGFGTLTGFSRSFKNKFGVPPSSI